MIIPTFIGSIAAGGVAGISSIYATVIALRATREAAEMRRLIPQWNELRDLESRMQSAKLEMAQLDARRVELTAHVQRAEEMAARVPGLERIVADLEEKKAALTPMSEEHQRLALQLSQRRLEIDQLISERAAVEKRLEELKAESERERLVAEAARHAAGEAKSAAEIARQQREALQGEAEALRAAIAELQERIVGMQGEVARLSAAESGLQAQIARHEQDLSGLRDRIAEAKAAQAIVESRIDELLRREEGLRETIAATETELRALGGEISKLQAERAALLAEIEGLRREIARLHAEREEARQALAALTKELTGMRQTATGGSFKLFEATQEVFDPYIGDERDEGGFATEELAVAQVAKHAKSLGFLYPDRVLRAFHTSLKLGRHAPLLVLAGISGTGKSQLPRLYCDALGINFLPMAVQPGWDSPADLVGFFSHIEHRFKPTPLARALVQMDRYFEACLDDLKKDAKKEFTEARQPREDQMLLVLLDEMNLARVEYYFSDFLSRLELRNSAGFDPDDPEMRKRVQLTLEAPGAEDRLKHLSIFPGDNVLFVGTMNEDESTMALSDKVIDRANVLRFGKPQALKSETGGKAKPNDSYLPISQWRAWTRSTDASAAGAKQIEQIQKWTDRLNDALDAVQRAFAHRTAAAIKAYCLAYPVGKSKQEDALKYAFSDQIEQRVMPKLRGIDPTGAGGQQAFEGVRGLIEELGDDELLAALERGLDANEGQSFIWYGTQRRADG